MLKNSEEKLREFLARHDSEYLLDDVPKYQTPPGFFGAIKTCFVKFWSVDSRASRSEAWYWTLFIVLITLAYTGLGTYYLTKPIADAVAGNEVGDSVKTTLKTGFWTLVIGSCVVNLLWLPTTAMWMRRFNDLNWPLWIALALCVLDFVLGMKFVSQLFPKPTDFGEALFIDAVRHIGTLTLLAINFKAGVPEINAFGPPFKRLSKSGEKVAQISEGSDEKS